MLEFGAHFLLDAKLAGKQMPQWERTFFSPTFLISLGDDPGHLAGGRESSAVFCCYWCWPIIFSPKVLMYRSAPFYSKLYLKIINPSLNKIKKKCFLCSGC